jgi:hypothetical protein
MRMSEAQRRLALKLSRKTWSPVRDMDKRSLLALERGGFVEVVLFARLSRKTETPEYKWHEAILTDEGAAAIRDVK